MVYRTESTNHNTKKSHSIKSDAAIGKFVMNSHFTGKVVPDFKIESYFSSATSILVGQL